MTAQQRRAKLAVKTIAELAKAEEKTRDAFNSRAQSLPVLLRSNGALRTVAFLESKAGGQSAQSMAAEKLLEVLATAARESKHLTDKGTLRQRLLDASGIETIRIEAELVEFSGWLKRMAAAEFGETDGHGDD